MSEHLNERVIEGAPRPEWGWGRIPVAAVVIVGVLLAAIIGMTSATSPWLPGDGGSPSAPAIVGQVLAVALAAGLCVLVGLIWVHTPQRSKARKKPRGTAIAVGDIVSGLRAGSLVLIGGILAVVALVIVFWFLLEQADVAQPPPSSGATTIGDAGVLPSPDPSPSAPAAFDWFFLGLIASIVIVLPVALLARRRLRVTDPEQDASDVPGSVIRAVGDSIGQIERDPDARRAIIRAYARMEHAFDDAGIPRRPHEAPFEYLGRTLRSLHVSPPAAGRLAELFERARFSKHVVGAETKHEAIGALREVERQMQAPPA